MNTFSFSCKLLAFDFNNIMHMVVQGYMKYKLKCAKTGVDYVPDSFTLEISNRQLIY